MQGLSRARWSRIEEILDRALDLTDAERAAFLGEVCGDDEALRAEVEALLAADRPSHRLAGRGRMAYTPYYKERLPMSTRTVRLDAQEEKLLAEIVRKTKLPVSEVLRRGLRALEKETLETAPRSPFEIYEQLDLGPGGYANRPATESSRGAREAILRKHHR